MQNFHSNTYDILHVTFITIIIVQTYNQHKFLTSKTNIYYCIAKNKQLINLDLHKTKIAFK